MTDDSPLKVGDYVIPAPDKDEDAEFLAIWDHIWTPCRVVNLYKNGGLRARADDKRTEWRGPASGFLRVGDA